MDYSVSIRIKIKFHPAAFSLDLT